jgi:heptaprenyl diphosphate synthase
VTTAVPLDFPDTAVEAAVASGLTRVEAVIRQTAQSEESLLTEASLHLVDAGGKRFRAMLVLLAAHFGDPENEQVIQAAAAIELTHLATLFHDDVMDEAVIRRGSESANSRWDNTVAILTGDFLFARASRILADLGAEAIRIQTETFARLVSGQVAETVGPRSGEDPLDHYWRVVTEKTASLIATSGRFGAMFSGAPDKVVTGVEVACEALGVAFQISDDILDICSETGQSGKTPGIDLREGVKSLPVMYALGSTDPADERLRALLSSGPLTSDADHAEALTLLRAHPAVKAAHAEMTRWAERAREQLLALPASPARSSFEKLCDFVVERTG